MKYLIMKFRMENAIRLFECGIFDKSALEYEMRLAIDWYAGGFR